MLLRLAYLGATNALAILRLLPMSDRAKDVEILARRHQISVLERQLSGQRVRFEASDRAFLAALLQGLPTQVLHRMRLLVRPDTVLRWHRDLIARRHAAQSRPKRGGRPRTVRSIRALVLRLAAENPAWGYRRLHGELLVLGVKVAASTVWEILKEAGIPPSPERTSTTTGLRRALGRWLRSPAGPQQDRKAAASQPLTTCRTINKKAAGLGIIPANGLPTSLSGRQDLNLRPLDPQSRDHSPFCTSGAERSAASVRWKEVRVRRFAACGPSSVPSVAGADLQGDLPERPL
ncbi:hypothetical protein OG535_29370 [Kitasatospora sp. NBC_00085]|uniref:helix-turn-helix domain-containing protein n=1 Tax=unclassified Kitasatospora TaxID=2633591 RepID=UPI0032543AFF